MTVRGESGKNKPTERKIRISRVYENSGFFYIINISNEVIMKNNQAKESVRQRAERIANSNNGLTLRTRTVPSKKKYNRQKENRQAFKD